MNQGFPRGVQNQVAARPTHDPQNQVLCDACGCENFRLRVNAFRTPSHILGAVDVTMDQIIVCEGCGERVDITKANLRRDVEKFESKPA